MTRPIRKHTGRARPAGPWKHGAIPVIGLIGGIGSGKSRVAALLAEAGAFVIDADAVGHALLAQSPVRDLVVSRFGPQVLAPAGTSPEDDGPPPIDRRALGALVFARPEALRQLEAILHPRMRRTFERAIARTVRRGQARAVVLDAAILLEAGWDSLCDRVVFVEAPRDQRFARLADARGWDDATLRAREAAQWPLDRKRELASAVVLNDSDPESLRERVRGLAAVLLPPAPPARDPGTKAGSRVASGPERGRPTPGTADAPRRR